MGHTIVFHIQVTTAKLGSVLCSVLCSVFCGSRSDSKIFNTIMDHIQVNHSIVCSVLFTLAPDQTTNLTSKVHVMVFGCRSIVLLDMAQTRPQRSPDDRITELFIQVSR